MVDWKAADNAPKQQASRKRMWALTHQVATVPCVLRTVSAAYQARIAMKIVRFQQNGKIGWGSLHNDVIYGMAGDIFNNPTETQDRFLLQDVKLLPPVDPPKIVAIALNYAPHIKESPYFAAPEVPMMFLKPPTCVIGHLDHIVLPADAKKIDYEGELAVVIGRKAKNVSESNALNYVLGCSIMNDVSARDYKVQDNSFTRSKGTDTFGPFGPCIATGLDPNRLQLVTRLNGNIVQSASTSEMLFHVPKLISFASQYMTLMPGDVIATGTPSGVNALHRGDVIEIEIEGIGVLKNFVS